MHGSFRFAHSPIFASGALSRYYTTGKHRTYTGRYTPQEKEYCN